MQNQEALGSAPARPRLVGLDIARTAALVAMAVYHFVFDLQLFGLVPPGTATQAGWRWLAYLTAGSFLCLAGMSLWLAHGARIRWRAFLRRLAMIAAAAATISLATWIAMPESFVFFGILHAICAASLLGLMLLRLPASGLAVLGVVVLLLPQWVRFAELDAPVFWWTGLQAIGLRSVDYVPIFPWLAPTLWGIALAKWADAHGLWLRLGQHRAPRWAERLAWPGRHSLLVYLVHQPVLIALIWLATLAR